jgi:uncharacterized protein YndB with AHSA1/START domain
VDTLRYSDAPPVEVDVLVDAPVAAVWQLVSDIDLPARFSTEFRGASWLDEPGVGARFVGRSSHPAMGDWETTCTVVSYSPGRSFGYRVGDPEVPSAQWLYTLSPSGAGTSLRYWMKMGPGWSGLCVAIERMPDKESKIVARRLAEFRTNMAATLAGIKELAEGAL